MSDPVRCLALVDLDDTLFSSARKQHDLLELVPAALLQSGDVVSYSNSKQRALHRLLACADELIPVTARSIEAYGRVLLRFAGRAVLSYGATILLPGGGIDTVWAQQVAPILARARVELESLQARVLAAYDSQRTGLQVRLISDGDDPAYLVVRQAPGCATQLLEEVGLTVVADWLAQHAGFTLHVNGRILAVIPPGLGKRAAVAYLIEQERRAHGSIFTIAAGDSLSDLDFMQLCDAAIVPTRTQLAEVLVGLSEQRREGQRQHLSIGRFES